MLAEGQKAADMRGYADYCRRMRVQHSVQVGPLAQETGVDDQRTSGAARRIVRHQRVAVEVVL